MIKLLLISTGGTISQRKDQFGTATSTNKETADKFSIFLQDLINAKNLNIQIDSRIILNKDSSNIIPADWDLMINTIVSEYDNYDAFLITHGTNTLGYTAAALSFALGKLGKKVIMTGSQVPYGYPGSDAVMNLENSIRVALYNEHELAGVIIVFGSNIIAGVRVNKATEFEYDAFKFVGGDPNSFGRVGRVLKISEDSLRAHMKWLEPQARNRKELDIKANFDMNIASLIEFPGMKSELLISLADKGIKGIIYQANGAGDPNVGKSEDTFENLRKGFEYLRKKRIPIVVASQATDGIASMDVNEPGVLSYELGAIPAWNMTTEVMTVKLAWLLGRKFPYEEIRSLMTQSFRGEISEVRRR